MTPLKTGIFRFMIIIRNMVFESNPASIRAIDAWRRFRGAL